MNTPTIDMRTAVIPRRTTGFFRNALNAPSKRSPMASGRKGMIPGDEAGAGYS